MKDGITLQQMLDAGILDHIDTLERISVKAALLGFKFSWRWLSAIQRRSDDFCSAFQAQKEHGLKTALTMMKKEPEPFCLEIDFRISNNP